MTCEICGWESYGGKSCIWCGQNVLAPTDADGVKYFGGARPPYAVETDERKGTALQVAETLREPRVNPTRASSIDARSQKGGDESLPGPRGEPAPAVIANHPEEYQSIASGHEEHKP